MKDIAYNVLRCKLTDDGTAYIVDIALPSGEIVQLVMDTLSPYKEDMDAFVRAALSMREQTKSYLEPVEE